MDKSRLTTFVTAALSSVVVPWLLSKGITLSPDSQVALSALIVGAIVGLAHTVHDKVAAPASVLPSPTSLPGSTPGTKAKGFVRWELAVTLALMTIVGGCAALGITHSLTFNEQLAAGYQTVTGIATSADQLHSAGKLSDKDAANVLTQDTNLREALDIAAQVHASNAKSGGDKLQAAITALNSLVSYLATYK